MSEPEASAQRRPSLAQRLVTRLLPGRAGDIERESQEWYVVCRHCGHARTFWEIGAVRYKAASKGQRIAAKCPSCGRRSLHRVERRPGEASAASP